MMKRLIVLLVILLAFALPALAEGPEVVINEVMASNGMYENEHSYDWIELHNRGEKAVDLSGWMLSDGKKNLAKFVFPKGAKYYVRTTVEPSDGGGFEISTTLRLREMGKTTRKRELFHHWQDGVIVKTNQVEKIWSSPKSPRVKWISARMRKR